MAPWADFNGSGPTRAGLNRLRTRHRRRAVLTGVRAAVGLRCRNCGVCCRGSPRLARRAFAAFAGVTADLGLQLGNVEEHVGLASQLVRDHRRLGRHRRSDGDAHAAPLHRLDQRAEIAVPGKQHHVVDVRGDLHGVDRELDIHVAFDLAAAGLIDEFFGRLGDDRIAVVIEPVDQAAGSMNTPDLPRPPCSRTRAEGSRATGTLATVVCNRCRIRAISRSHRDWRRQ